MKRLPFTKSQDVAGKPAADATDDPSRLEILKKNFMVARRGNFFRTVAFKSQIGGDALGTSYMRAVEDPDTFRWMLQEVTVQPNFSNENLPAGAPIVRPRTRAANIEFFAAVESLANFEMLQFSRGNRVEGENAEDLGKAHYKTFAESEGLVFDLNGRPHPTQQGLIVTDGDFMPGAEESAIANYREPLPDRVWTAGALSQLFDQVRASKALDGLTILMAEREQWQKILDTNKVLYAYANAWRLHRDNPENASVSDSTKMFIQDKVLFSDIFWKHWSTYESARLRSEDGRVTRLLNAFVPGTFKKGDARRYAFFETLKSLRQMAPDSLDKDSKVAYEKMCLKHELYFMLFYSNKMMSDLLKEKNQAMIKAFRSQAEEGAARLEKLSVRLDYSPARIQAFKAAIYSGEILPDAPNETKAFIDACTKKLGEIEKAVKEQRVKIATPTPGY